MWVLAVLMECMAYGFFFVALLASTGLWMDARREGFWERHSIVSFLKGLRALVMTGTFCHIMAVILAS